MLMNQSILVRTKGTYEEIRGFKEELDADFIRMRMIATWGAQETMERSAGSMAQRGLVGPKGAYPITCGCPVKPTTPLGPDQVNVLLFSMERGVSERDKHSTFQA
jgi:hypothetical protein